ncbi:MAG: aldo/keto reductase [Parasporobacterium sp.]|nr:aldo/keto reductase [Parasporobacterium sp.]
MKKISIPKTGLTISAICLGTDHYGGKIPEETAFVILDRFLEMGGNILDTANIYGKWLPAGENASERVIGKWIRSRGISDQRMLVATKGGHYDLSDPGVSRVREDSIRADLDESLRALNRDHADIYYFHRDREEIPAGELLEWMERLVSEGKIRYYAASNFRSERMDEAAAYAKAHGLKGFIGLQNRFSLAVSNPAPAVWDTMRSMDRDFFAWHVRTQTPLFPYTSSAHGYFAKLVSGTVPEAMKKEYGNAQNDAIFRLLCRESEESGKNVFVLAQAFLQALPFPVVPLMTAAKPEQLDDFEDAADFDMPGEWTEKYLQVLEYPAK